MVGPPRLGDDDDDGVCLVCAGYDRVCVFMQYVCVRARARAHACINV
jgi:hypothetical protein